MASLLEGAGAVDRCADRCDGAARFASLAASMSVDSMAPTPDPAALLAQLQKAKPYPVDHLPALAHLWDQLGFTDVLNQAIPYDPDQVVLCPGHALKALALNTTAGRDPLYRVALAYKDRPTEHLIAEGVTHHQLNDDALGRTLDRLHKADPEKIYNLLALKVLERGEINLDRVHTDTTSKLLFGQYKHPEDHAVSITYGHSKVSIPRMVPSHGR